MSLDGGGAGLFRSRDSQTVWRRDSDGILQELTPDRRDVWVADERHRTMAEALGRYGLWSHLPPDQRAAAEADVATGCHPLDFDLLAEQIEFFADGESLAEGGVEEFLAEIAPALRRYGLVLRVAMIAQPYRRPGDRDYILSINDIRCTIWTADEPGAMWEESTIRPLAVVNQLLAVTSPVRAHTLYAGGNDGFVLLIDPWVAEAMRASGLFSPDEIPALAGPV